MPTAQIAAPSLEQIRAQFPSLATGFAFLENAGGSQVPKVVLDAIRRFMEEDYVQTGAGYPASDRATQLAADAHAFLNLLMNGQGIGHTAVGPSTTALLYMLANCMAQRMSPGDEVVVSIANHESNAGPWARLADQGIVVKWWMGDPETGLTDLKSLDALLSNRTKVVAFPQTSNVLGEVTDVAAIAKMAHEVGAKVVVDGVATTSHRAPDVAAFDADFYIFSNYKVYGPHMASLFGKTEAWLELKGPNHFFVRDDELPRKFELGCNAYESLAGVMALGQYYKFLAGEADDALPTRSTIEDAYRRMQELEAPLQSRLVEYLLGKEGVRLFGPRTSGPERVPTIAFVHDRLPSDAIARHVNSRGIGIRTGHMYAYRLCEALGIQPDPGAVRISAVHYNSIEEIDRVISALEEVL